MTNPAQPTLADLLHTWQTWSYRNLLRSSLGRAVADGNAEHQAVLGRALEREPAVPPLDALAANHELSSLLRGWQWHAIRDARAANEPGRSLVRSRPRMSCYILKSPRQSNWRWRDCSAHSGYLDAVDTYG